MLTINLTPRGEAQPFIVTVRHKILRPAIAALSGRNQHDPPMILTEGGPAICKIKSGRSRYSEFHIPREWQLLTCRFQVGSRVEAALDEDNLRLRGTGKDIGRAFSPPVCSPRRRRLQ